MSLNDHRGYIWAMRELHQQVQDEIDRGERKGATVKWKTANPAKTMIGWFRRRILREEFRKRA